MGDAFESDLDRRIAEVRARPRRTPGTKVQEDNIPEGKLRELAADTGFSLADAAEVFGVSTTAVSDRCARYGIPWRGKRRAVDEAALRAVALDPRVSTTEAGRRLGVSGATVLVRWGEIGEGPWVRAGAPSGIPIDSEWLREQALDPNVSATKAAAEIGCSAATIARRWRHMGEDPWQRPRPPRPILEPLLRAQAADPAITVVEAAESFGVSASTLWARWTEIRGPAERWAHGRKTIQIDPEWLRKRALDPTVSVEDAAAEAFVSVTTIRKRWGAMGEGPWVRKARNKAQIIPEAWLRGQAANPAISVSAAARSRGVSASTIAKWWAKVRGPNERWVTKPTGIGR